MAQYIHDDSVDNTVLCVLSKIYLRTKTTIATLGIVDRGVVSVNNYINTFFYKSKIMGVMSREPIRRL